MNLLSSRYKYDGTPSPLYALNMEQELAIYEFSLDLENGVFETEFTPCDCGNDDFDIVAERDRYGLPCQSVMCKRCGLVMTNPHMTQSSYNLFYEKYYRRIYSGSDQASDVFFQEQVEHGNVIKKILEKKIDFKNISNILEIGCGAGGILVPFANVGLNVKGIDLGSSYLQYGISQGLNLENINSRDLLSRGSKYDLIILSHVAEHFVDLESEFKCIHELLSEDGILYIEVPGINNVSINGSYAGDLLLYFQNAHVRQFSLVSLRNSIAKYGFDLLAGDEQVVSIFVKSTSFSPIAQTSYEDAKMHLLEIESAFESAYKEYMLPKSESVKLEIEQEYSDKWIYNLEHQKYTSSYLLNHGYDHVSICGTGMITQLLINELKNENFTIDYIIDTSSNSSPIICENIPTISIDNVPDNINCVILSTPLESLKLRNTLMQKGITNVIPFFQIILELLS